MSIGTCFSVDDDDDHFDPYADEHKKYDVNRIHDMMRDVRREQGSYKSDALFYGSRNMLYLAYAPLAGPIVTSFYGVGLLMNAFAPIDKSFTDYLTGDFDRRASFLRDTSYGYFGKTREIVSQTQRIEHATVSKCAMMCLFGGCLGNSMVSRRINRIRAYHQLPPQAYFTKEKAPFFLLGAFGIALSQYAATYNTERNKALLKEAEYLAGRLIE